MKQLFEPVKFLYGLFKSPVEELDDTKEIIESYNSMFKKKQDTPWMGIYQRTLGKKHCFGYIKDI
jgi:hypothetical protein